MISEANERLVIQPFPPRDGAEWECQCARCGSSADWRECEQCDEDGFDGHDCWEDCCVCLYPQENVPCQVCDGHCGDYWCVSSPDWCNSNPREGREQIERGKIEWFRVIDAG